MSPVTAETRVEWSTRLAEALVKGGYETESNLAPLVAESRATGQSLAALLISRQLALPGVVVGALAHLAQLPAIDLAVMNIGPEAKAAMPDDVAEEYEAVAVQLDGNVLAVAFGEPPSEHDLESLAARVGCRINPVLADPVVIAQSLSGSGNGNVAHVPAGQVAGWSARLGFNGRRAGARRGAPGTRHRGAARAWPSSTGGWHVTPHR